MNQYVEVLNARAKVAELEAALIEARRYQVDVEEEFVLGGPDVSSYQGDVDWTKVRAAGYELAFVKISDGDVVDPTYTKGRVTTIRSTGLLMSPYYFARVASPANNERNGKSEAAMAVYFAERMGWGKGDLPLAYDFETTNGQPNDKAVKHLLEFVRAYRYLKGHMPIIYTGPSFFSSLQANFTAQDIADLQQCPLWISHWTDKLPTIPSLWSDWTFWQYTDKGSVPGISTACDINRCGISKTQLMNLVIK